MKKVKKLEKKIEGLREEIQTLHLESRLEIEDHFQATYFKGLPLTRVSSYDFEGKLCNKCYGNKGEGDSGFGKGMFGGL